MGVNQHGVILRIDDDDYCRLRAVTGNVVSEIERAIQLHCAQLPEPVEVPRSPGVTRIAVAYENKDFEKFRELDDPLDQHFWRAIRDYKPQSQEAVFVEGKLSVPNFRVSEQCTKYTWEAPSDLVSEFLPTDIYERGCFLRAALKSYVKANCQNIRPLYSGKRTLVEFRILVDELERLRDLGGNLERHLQLATRQYLAKRKPSDSMRPMFGELDRADGESINFRWSCPMALRIFLPDDPGDCEHTVRTAIRSYLPKAEAELAKSEVA